MVALFISITHLFFFLCSQMDKASTLGDAVDYIKDLQEAIEDCRDELRAIEEEDCNKVNAKPDLPIWDRVCADKKGGASEKTPIEVRKTFLISGT